MVRFIEFAVGLVFFIVVAFALAHELAAGLDWMTTQHGRFRITVYHPNGATEVYDAVKYQPLDGHRANVWCRDGRELVICGDFTTEEIK